MMAAWIGVAGLVAALVGAVVAAWGLAGDRARGRRRCGRCWYDMGAVVGLKCPECGRDAKGERDLRRTRRRWRWVIVGVLLVGGAAEAVRRGKTPVVQQLPTRVVAWFLPRAEDEAGRASGSNGPPAMDWASEEMRRRFRAGSLTPEEIGRALTGQGVLRTWRTWPVGTVVYAEVLRVSWLGTPPRYVVFGPDQPVIPVVDVADVATTVAELGWSEATAVLEVTDSSNTGPIVNVPVRVSYRGVERVAEMVPDASPAAWAEVERSLKMERTETEVRFRLERRGVKTELAVEIELAFDRGLGWEPWSRLVGSDRRLTDRGFQIQDLSHHVPSERGEWFAVFERGDLRPSGEWKVRFRGVKPRHPERWPVPRYWAGEVVMTVPELQKRAGAPVAESSSPSWMPGDAY